MSEMATPEEHTAKGVLPTPTAFAGASTGAAAFQNWLEEEEEEWRLERMLEAKCPKEFICPISLDIMADPVILVRSHTSSHKHLKQRLNRWVATGGSLPAEAAINSHTHIPLFTSACVEKESSCQHVRLR